MFLRFLGIVITKWITLMAVLTLVMVWLLPGATGWFTYIPMGILTIGIAFAFAEWAFQTALPDRRTTLELTGIWILVTVALQFFAEWWTFGAIWFLRYSRDLYMLYFLEILAIFLAAYVTRRRHVRAVLGE